MHPTTERFVETARREYGLEIEVHEFPEGTKTAADAAQAIGCDVAQIASSIVFAAGNEVIVVVTSGANRVSEDRLAAFLGEDSVRMAEAEEVKRTTGWSIGGVPPFGHEQALTVLLDETLTAFDTVWAAAGTPSGVFPVDPDVIIDRADATVVDVAE